MQVVEVEVEEPVLLVVMGDMTLVLGRPWHILHFLHPTVTTVRSYIVCGTYYVPTHLDPGGEGHILWARTADSAS